MRIENGIPRMEHGNSLVQAQREIFKKANREAALKRDERNDAIVGEWVYEHILELNDETGMLCIDVPTTRTVRDITSRTTPLLISS